MARVYESPSTRSVAMKLVLPQCPVTCGRPTRMTKASFDRACKRFFRAEVKTDFGEKLVPGFCQVCQGKQLPAELTLIDESQLDRLYQHTVEQRTKGPAAGASKNNEVEYMARKAQVCDGCGKTKMLSNCSGDLLCSSCAATAGSISNRPDAVAKMIVKRGQTEVILAAMGVGEVVAATVDSELLQKLAGLVGYEGESGDELYLSLEQMAQQLDIMTPAVKGYQKFVAELNETIGGPDSVLVSTDHLLEEVRIGVACREAVEKVSEVLCLPDEFTNDQVVDSVSDLLEALANQQQPKGQDQYKAELVVATAAIAEICKPLGLDPADEDLQYKDIAIAVAQTAAVLEHMERSRIEAVTAPLDQLPPISLVEQLTGERRVCSWGDIVQTVELLRGDLADIKRAKNILDEQWDTVAVTLEADSFAAEDVLAAVNRLTAKANNLQYRLNAISDQAAEAEQRLLADEQVFARIREVIDGDGVTNGDLPTVIEQMVRRVGGAPLRLKRPEIDSHLLDLLVDFPQIGVERIAVLREAA